MPAKSKADRDLLRTYRETHARCAVCYAKEKPWRKLSVHHIVGRRGKSPHDHRNLICLCEDTCHDGVHRTATGCSLDLGHILTAKEEEDGKVDVRFLASLLARVGLREDPKPLPAWVLAARIDNRSAR